MGDRSKEAVTYLPASLLRASAAQAAAPPNGLTLPFWHEVDGTMVMADLSGFTALSEKLAGLGDEGAERLTSIIDSFFERMLKTAAYHGGDTLTFGGDAILLLFDGLEHATRAVVAAREMLKQVLRAAAVDAGNGKVKIGMSVGAHSDHFLLAGVGLPEERANLLVLGRPAELTALAEAQAERGELAVSTPTKDRLLGEAVLTATGDYWRVDELSPMALPHVDERPAEVNERTLRRLKPFLPPDALEVTQRGDAFQLTPEHRRVAMVFINVLGVEEVIERSGPVAAVRQLQTYAASLTDLAANHHGFVVSCDIATRGSKFILTFGAPVAHEYAASNAARFALELNGWLAGSDLALQHRIGVNGGHVFAGEIAPAFRRQYTVMGDAVNLAARLMAAAPPGEVYASHQLLEQAGPAFRARDLQPIKVKGKERPVAVCVLEGEQSRMHLAREPRGSQTQSPFFGRIHELERWQAAVRDVQVGSGRAILLEGEAGVGKTRLLEEWLKLVPATAEVLRATCFEHLSASPFAPWVDLLSVVLGTSGEESARSRTVKVQRRLETSGLAEFGSLLNPLLNLQLPHSKVVAALDVRARRHKLFELLAAMLCEGAAQSPRVILMEDAHWMDESSRAFVTYLARSLRDLPVLLVASTRPMEQRLDLGSAREAILLGELSKAESLAMVRGALGVEELPVEVGDEVFAKTKGNPLFLEEVIHALQQPGLVEGLLSPSSVARSAALASLQIPDRVQGLLMSRIDQLPSDAREVLKAGAVAGRSFDKELLRGIDDRLLRTVEFERAFEALLAARLVATEDTASSVSFRHALVQDVAYESLPFSRRRQLHAEIGRCLEETRPFGEHGLLVHHFSRAGDHARTRVHAVRASESSVAVSAHLEAIDYLEIALATVTGRSPSDACLRSRFEELAGDNLETLARHGEAIERFRTARRRWSSPTVRAAAAAALNDLGEIEDPDARESQLCWKIGAAAERSGSSYLRALRWLESALAALPPVRPGLAGRILITKSFCLYRLGRLQDSLELGKEGLALARKVGDVDLQAYACTIRSLTLYQLGLLDEAIAAGEEGVVLYEEVGDVLGQARSHNNLAASYQLRGQLRDAIDHMELSLALYAKVAHTDGVAMQHCNIGAVLLDMGEIEESRAHLEQTIAFRESSECPPGLIGWSLVLLARARLLLGDLHVARDALVEGCSILRSSKTEALLLDADVVDAELLLAEGRPDDAETVCGRVVAEARASGAEPTEGEALRVLGLVHLAQGRPDKASAELRDCVDLAEKGGEDFLRAQALTVLAEAEAACAEGDPACEDLLSEAI